MIWVLGKFLTPNSEIACPTHLSADRHEVGVVAALLAKTDSTEVSNFETLETLLRRLSFATLPLCNSTNLPIYKTTNSPIH